MPERTFVRSLTDMPEITVGYENAKPSPSSNVMSRTIMWAKIEFDGAVKVRDEPRMERVGIIERTGAKSWQGRLYYENSLIVQRPRKTDVADYLLFVYLAQRGYDLNEIVLSQTLSKRETV